MAGGTLASVDVELPTVLPHFALRVSIIPDGRTSGVDGPLKDVTDRAVEGARPSLIDRGHRRSRVDSCQKERLSRVDVPHTRDPALVEEP